MKRVDLIRTIEGFGCVLVRHGGKHDWYRNPVTGKSQPVPRYRDIKEGLAQPYHQGVEQSHHCGDTMSIKEQVIHGLDTLSEAELTQVADFLAFLKFRARLQPMPELDETQLATLYAACAEEDRALAEEGMAEYTHGLCQEDVS